MQMPRDNTPYSCAQQIGMLDEAQKHSQDPQPMISYIA